MKALILIPLFLFFLSSCAPSEKTLRSRAENKKIALLSIIKKIETKEDLILAGPKIEKQMGALVDLMIELHKIRASEIPETEASFQLQAELKRIYRMEGSRQLMEEYERPALIKLHQLTQASPSNSRLFSSK